MKRGLAAIAVLIIVGLVAALVWQVFEVRNYRRLVTTIDRAMAGYAIDEFELAEMYYFGNRRLDPKGKRYDEAARLYRSSAEKGYTHAEYRLGELYLRAEGVVGSVSEAKKWLGRAAGKNYAPAIRELGKLYFDGKWVPRDSAKGKTLLIKAGKLGDYWAYLHLMLHAVHASHSGMTREHRIEIYKWSWLAKRAGAKDFLLYLGIRDSMSESEVATAIKQARAIIAEKPAN